MPRVAASHAVARLRSAGLTVKATTTTTAATVGNNATTFSRNPWTTTTHNSNSHSPLIHRGLQASGGSAADAAVASSAAVESGIAFGANNFYGSTTTPTGNGTTLPNATNDNSNINNTNGQFNPVVFWGVNAFIAFLLITACTWCWWCGGWKWSATTASSSDVEYRRRLAEQQQRQQQQQTALDNEDLETRQRKIVASFERCRVKQVVTGQDFVAGPESSFTADAAAINSNIDNDELAGGNRLERLETNHDDPDHTTVVGAVSKILLNGNSDMSFSDLKEEDDDDDDDDDDHADYSKIKDDRKQEEMDLEAAVIITTTTTAATRESQIEDNVTAPLSFSSSSDIHIEQEASDNENRGGEKDEDDYNDDDECDAGHIRIQGGHRLVPNCCAICLSHYEIGETIVWSSNTDCRHAFHEECITDWLVKLHAPQPQQPSPPSPSESPSTPVVVATPCPCCRQEFTVLEEDEEESRVDQKVLWRPGRMFQPRNFSSRE